MSATDELFELLASVGATPTLYGKPTTAAEVKAYAIDVFIDRLATAALQPEPQWRPWDLRKEEP